MRKLICLILLVVCCNTWASEVTGVDSKMVEPYWVSNANMDSFTVIFICNANKENCKCFIRNGFDDNRSTKEFECPKQPKDN